MQDNFVIFPLDAQEMLQVAVMRRLAFLSGLCNGKISVKYCRGGGMKAEHLRLFEITQSVGRDPLGKALMDEVLTSCFDHALGSCGSLARLVAAMNKFNSYLSGYAPPVSQGLFSGSPEELALWAEQLTSQLVARMEQ
jgi:hypothetical protein